MKNMIRIFNRHNLILLAILAILSLSSCNDDVSYADRLNQERNAVNAYLANHRVEMSVPEDSVFEEGEDAPFYRIDPDGNVYMQVIKSGDRKGDRAHTGEPIYFRFTRYSLSVWYANGVLTPFNGNENAMDSESCSFKYADFTLPSTSQWGYGLQLPLNYLGVECEVNLVIKSQFGLTSEISQVMPFLYHVRYFHSMI